MDKPIIMGIGELVWDMLPDGKELGGAPVNFAYWCGRLGAEGYPFSAVGDDAPGREALERLAAAGLDTGYIQRNTLPTGRVDVTLRDGGIPAYDIVEGVAWDALQADARTEALARRADAVCWGSLAQRSEPSRRAIGTLLDATRAECLKIFDINLRQDGCDRRLITESLERADLLKLNEEELPRVAALLGIGESGTEAIRALVGRFALRCVIYTAGADRSEIHGSGGVLSRIPTPRVEVVDTVGAGDSFTAAFVTALLQGDSVAVCHRKAVETAARVCMQRGAIPPAR